MSLMFTFSLGMGAILVVAGTIAEVLCSLPKSGKWLVIVKRAFAFLLLLSAEYFLIQAGRMM